MKRLAAAGALVVVAAIVLAPHSMAQLPPITIPLVTPTTVAPPPPAATTTTARATTTTTTVANDATLDTVAVPLDTIPAELPVADVTSTSLPAPRPPVTRPPTVALPTGLRAASVTGAFGLGLGGVLIVALLLVLLTTIARSQLTPGGSPMTSRRRARLIAGVACLALAAVVGLVGYLKLSLETDVNRQIPYLASAGMAVVLLAAAGGAFIVGEQMRTDEQRIDELEAAVQQLANIVAPTVEAPPRTRKAAARKS